MRLTDLLRAAPGVPARRRRRPRPDAPRTIVPAIDEQPDAEVPMTARLDAARERLRRAIPPLADD